MTEAETSTKTKPDSDQNAPQSKPSEPTNIIEVELRDPLLAAFMGWLVPGLGHIYQGRIAKGVLFAVCILGTYFFGLFVGDNHVVFASNSSYARMLQFGCQACVGLPVTPAIYQAVRVRMGREAPIRDADIAEWNRRLGSGYDLGVLYTVCAGLLNVLAICDAYAGPMFPLPEDPNKKKMGKSNKDGPGTSNENPPQSLKPEAAKAKTR